MNTTINLQPASPYRGETYGVLLESETQHDVTGPGVHNRHHPHRLDVWEHRRRYNDGDEVLWVDPHGNPTKARYSYLLSARPVVIAARPVDRTPEGPALAIGDVVTLAIHGYELGQFRVTARPLADPVLVPLTEAEREQEEVWQAIEDLLTPDPWGQARKEQEER